MFGGRSIVDSVHTVDTRTWRKHLLSATTWREVRRSLGAIREQRNKVAVDFQGAIKSALAARASGAAEIYGFAQPRESAAKLWYTSQVNATAAHVIDQNLQLASAVARKTLAAERFELPHSPEADDWCLRTLDERRLKQFVLLNPGSGWGAKCWPKEKYMEVARKLGKTGLRSLINFGPGEEPLAQSIATGSEGAAEAVSCSLSQLIALIRRSALFIGGDTGPMHLAAALKVPIVALFGPTDPARNGPYWKPAIVLRNESSITSYKHVAQTDAGLQAITVEAVMSAAAQLLGVPIG